MYKRPALFLLFFLLGSTAGFNQKPANADTRSKEQEIMSPLFGTWEIDLRPSPNDSPYLKEFIVSSFEEGKLRGFFYDSPFSNGRVNSAWGKVYFAFTTADNSGTYYHSGHLENGKLYGTSFSPARGFMLPWWSTQKKQ
jgi:hypothetical protein